MTRANILICIAIAVVSISFWALLNKQGSEPPWPKRIQGFSFSPMQAWNDQAEHNLPTVAEIESDLKLVSDKTYAIRLYTTEGVLAEIPSLAKKYGLNVTLGAWLDKNLEENERQIETVIRLAKENFLDTEV